MADVLPVVTFNHIDVAGWIMGTVIEKETNGHKYLTWKLQSANGVNNGLITYECFTWFNTVYTKFKSYNFKSGDNVLVRGEMTVSEYVDRKGQPKIMLRISVDSLKAINTSAYFKDAETEVTIPVQKNVQRINNQNVNDDDFNWGDDR